MANRLEKVMAEIKREKYSWVESASAVFAFLNIESYLARYEPIPVAVSISSLVTLGFLIGTSVETLTSADDSKVAILGIGIGINTGILIIFAFAIILYIGIYQKKPGFVLAYFIFGIIIDIAMVSAVVVVNYAPRNEDVGEKLLEIFDNYCEPVSHAVIWICVVYTLVLIMICRTWWLMTSRRSEDQENLANYYYQADWEKD